MASPNKMVMNKSVSINIANGSSTQVSGSQQNPASQPSSALATQAPGETGKKPGSNQEGRKSAQRGATEKKPFT